MNQEVLQLLNEQVNLELASAYLYYDMSTAMKSQNVNGFAHWLALQAHEEIEHAEKFIHFLLELGQEPELKTIALERPSDRSPLALAKATLAHEKTVTESILNLRKAALEAGEQAVEIFLQRFVSEQVEEESNARDVLDLIQLAGDDASAKLRVDAILASRE